MIRVEKIIPGGQALGTLEDGRKIFFWNALPGENVAEYEITKQKSHYVEAIATKIENPSKFRVIPKDDCYLSTSPWQILDWDYESQLKADLVVEIFREHHIDITRPDVLTDNNPYYYRNKMEYALYWDNKIDKIKLAFHARGSHKKIPIETSSIERPEILATAQQIIDDLNNRHEEARKYQSILLRCSQNGEVSGGLYENHRPHPVFNNLTDQILGQTYSYSPNGFFQINIPVYELALKEIKKYINTDNVLDLYSGVGTIGLSVARDKRITLVEVDRSAYAELDKNCKNIIIEDRTRLTRSGMSEASPVTDHRRSRVSGRSIFRIEATPGGRPGRSTGRSERVRNDSILAVNAKSEEVLNYLEPNQTVILDPPRAGCDRKLIDKLLEVTPKTIIYLSCNPATQARDVKFLLDKYKIKDIKTFNFFPRTPHIENLVILSLK